jgi:galactokinase
VNNIYQTSYKHFQEHFGIEPLIIRSPGRINLIGEHTDYNDGFVMPAAIDKEIVLAIAPSNDATSRIYSFDFHQLFEIDLLNPQPVKSPLWANYILGVARQFVDRGVSLKPFNCFFGGNIPKGSGLSSSAALEGAFAFAFHELNRQSISRIDLAKIGQWSEHNFVGVRCGIMDQFANMMGKEDHVIRLDCRSMEYEYFPFRLRDHTIVLFNSGVKHSLASSEYNVRRSECEEGVRILQKKYPAALSLRDVSVDMLHEMKHELSHNVYDRCRYIVDEIVRVQSASDDLQRNDLPLFGKRMYQTHDGLSKLYKVSCEELDYLVGLVKDNPAVLGSRMMGGGFGGCTINLIQNNAVESVVNHVRDQYKKKYRIDPEIYKVQIKNGTGLVNL